MSNQTIAHFVSQIVAGTNITITYTGGLPGTGQVTINSTGGGSGVLPNDTYLEGRNFANTLDVGLIKIDAADNTIVHADTGNLIVFNIGATDLWGINSGGVLTPFGNNTQDLGFSTFAIKTAYIGTSILGTTATLFIGTVSTDGADDNRLVLSASDAQGANRGGEIVIAGNEAPGDLGSIYLQAGSEPTGGHIGLVATSTAGKIRLGTQNTYYWVVDAGNFIPYTDGVPSIGSDTFRVNTVTTQNLKIKTHAAYTASGSYTLTAAVDTTNATVTTLATFTLADNTSYKFRVELIGRLNSATDKNIWGTLDFGVRRNNGSAAVLIGTAIKVTDSEGAPGYDFDVDVTGNTVRIRVTGATGETVSWEGEIKYLAVSTAA